RVHDTRRDAADRECVAVGEELVELAAVTLECGSCIEDLAERVLNDGDVLTDADATAELLLDIGRGREMIGMNVGLQNPVELQAVAADEFDQAVGRVKIGTPGERLVVEHRVDHRADAGRGVAGDIAYSIGGLVKE